MTLEESGENQLCDPVYGFLQYHYRYIGFDQFFDHQQIPKDEGKYPFADIGGKQWYRRQNQYFGVFLFGFLGFIERDIAFYFGYVPIEQVCFQFTF